MSATATSRTRRPAGTPAGGQFAAETHAEPEVSLGGFASPEEFVAAARQSVAFWVARSPWMRLRRETVDDTAQDLAVAFLAYARDRELENPRGYLHTMARHAVSGRGDRRKSDLAADGAGFNLWSGEAADSVLPPSPSAEDEAFDGDGSAVSPNSGLGRLHVALQQRSDAHSSSTSALAMGAIRGSLWSVLSERAGVHVGLASTSRAAASRARSSVEQAGGAAAVARAWGGGEPEPGAEAALFRPFAVETDADRRAVVSVLMRHADYAEDIWSAALFGSSHSESRLSGVA